MTPPIPAPRALPAPVSDRKAGGCLVSCRHVSAAPLAAVLFLFAITMASAAGTHRTDCISASQAGHTITLPEGFTITPCDDGTYRLEDSRSHGGTNCIYLGFGPKTDNTLRSGNLLWASTPHSQTREYTSTTPNPFIPGDSTRAALMHIRIVADNESIASYLKDIANHVVENARAFGGGGGGSGQAFTQSGFTRSGISSSAFTSGGGGGGGSGSTSHSSPTTAKPAATPAPAKHSPSGSSGSSDSSGSSGASFEMSGVTTTSGTLVDMTAYYDSINYGSSYTYTGDTLIPDPSMPIFDNPVIVIPDTPTFQWDPSYGTQYSGSVSDTNTILTLTAVPEPRSLLLLLTAASLPLLRRFKKK